MIFTIFCFLTFNENNYLKIFSYFGVEYIYTYLKMAQI